MSQFTDTELLDALEKQGMGIAVIHDDSEHWFVAVQGMQPVIFDGPRDFKTTYFCEKEFGRKTIREAISAWVSGEVEL